MIKYTSLTLILFLFISTLKSQSFLGEINIDNEVNSSNFTFKENNQYDSIWLNSLDINDEDLFEFIKRAQYKIEYGYYSEAIDDLNKAISLEPEYSTSYLLKGIVQLNLDSLKQANYLLWKTITFNNQDPSAYYYLGQTQLLLDSTQEAKTSFKTSVKLDPNFTLAYFSLGNLSFMKANLGKAKSYYKKTIECDPLYAPAYTNKGIIEVYSNQINSARKTFGKAIEANPDFAGAYFMKGYLNLLKKKLKITKSDWDNALKIDSTNGLYLFARANLFMYFNEYDNAYNDISKAIKYNPVKKDRFREYNKRTSLENMQALQTIINIYKKNQTHLSQHLQSEIKKSICLFSNGEYKHVNKHLHNLLNHNPTNGLLMFLIAYNYEFLTNNEKARYYYNQSLANKPFIDESLLRLGIYYCNAGMYNESEDIISKYIEKHDSDCLAYRFIGISKMRLNKFNYAIRDFSKFLSLDSTEYDILFNRGYSYLYVNKLDSAILDFTKLIDYNSSDRESYYGRGLCFFRKKDLKKSLQDLDSALKINQYYSDAIFLRAKIMVKVKNYDEAIDGFNKVLHSKPNHIKTLSERASLFYKLKRYDEALADYNKLISIDLSNGNAYFFRGLVYLRLKKDELACADLQKAFNKGVKKAQNVITKYCK